MTVIAAIPTNDGVIMAADTLLMRRESVIGTTRKISRLLVGPKYEHVALLGLSGSHALAEVAHHRFHENAELPDCAYPDDTAKADYWAHRVAVKLATLAHTAEPPLTVDDGEMDGEALLALGPRLWLLSGQSAVPISAPFAIGSGADVARGSLHAAAELGLVGNYPYDALRLAVRAAMELNAYCGGEIQIEPSAAIVPNS
jgi:ATP-dependent protease HslVU (ClpYQ) peptidase subunit